MTPRALWIGLGISLAVNVFVVGAFVGARLSGGPQPAPAALGGPDVRPRNPVALAIRDLSPEARAAWRAESAAFGARVSPKMREARRLNQAAFRSLGDPDFDPETSLADLQRARALELEGRVEMDRRLVAFARTLSPEDRSRLAAALARPRKPGGPGSRL